MQCNIAFKRKKSISGSFKLTERFDIKSTSLEYVFKNIEKSRIYDADVFLSIKSYDMKLHKLGIFSDKNINRKADVPITNTSAFRANWRNTDSAVYKSLIRDKYILSYKNRFSFGEKVSDFSSMYISNYKFMSDNKRRLSRNVMMDLDVLDEVVINDYTNLTYGKNINVLPNKIINIDKANANDINNEGDDRYLESILLLHVNKTKTTNKKGNNDVFKNKELHLKMPDYILNKNDLYSLYEPDYILNINKNYNLDQLGKYLNKNTLYNSSLLHNNLIKNNIFGALKYKNILNTLPFISQDVKKIYLNENVVKFLNSDKKIINKIQVTSLSKPFYKTYVGSIKWLKSEKKRVKIIKLKELMSEFNDGFIYNQNLMYHKKGEFEKLTPVFIDSKNNNAIVKEVITVPKKIFNTYLDYMISLQKEDSDFITANIIASTDIERHCNYNNIIQVDREFKKSFITNSKVIKTKLRNTNKFSMLNMCRNFIGVSDSKYKIINKTFNEFNKYEWKIGDKYNGNTIVNSTIDVVKNIEKINIHNLKYIAKSYENLTDFINSEIYKKIFNTEYFDTPTYLWREIDQLWKCNSKILYKEDRNIGIYVQEITEKYNKHLFKNSYINIIKNNQCIFSNIDVRSEKSSGDIHYAYIQSFNKNNHIISIPTDKFINKNVFNILNTSSENATKNSNNVLYKDNLLLSKVKIALSSIIKLNKISRIKNNIGMYTEHQVNAIKNEVKVYYKNITRLDKVYGEISNSSFTLSGKKIENSIFEFFCNTANKMTSDLYVDNYTDRAFKADKYIHHNIIIGANKFDINITCDNTYISADKYKLNINQDDMIYLRNNIRCTNITSSNYWINKINKSIYNNLLVSTTKNNVKVNYLGNIFFKKIPKDISNNDNIFAYNNRVNDTNVIINTWFDKIIYDIYTENRLWVNKIDENTYIYNHLISAEKCYKSINSYTNKWISKIPNSIIVNSSINANRVFMQDTFVFKDYSFNKTQKSAIYKDILHFNKRVLDFYCFNDIKSCTKEDKDTYTDTFFKCDINKNNKDVFNNYITSFYNTSKVMNFSNNDFVGLDKELKNLSILSGESAFFSKYRPVHTEDGVHLVLDKVDVTISNNECKWFYKFSYPVLIQNIIKANLGSKDIDETNVIISYTKNNKDTMSDNKKLLSKDMNDTSIDNKDIVLKKQYKDTVFDKSYSWLINDNKDTYLSYDMYLSKIYKGISTKSNTWLIKNSTNIMIDDTNMNIANGVKLTAINNFEILDLQYKNIALENFTVINKEDIDTNIFDNNYELNNEKYINEDANNTFLSKNDILQKDDKLYTINKVFTALNNDDLNKIVNKAISDCKDDDNGVIVTKLKHLLDKVPEIEKVIANRELKEVYIECSKVWIDGDNYDKPSLTAGGVDELLLPGTDYDYTKLQGKIIDDNGRPIGKDCEIVDSKTFITNTPIKHPLPETDGIGIKYIDLNINVLRHMIDVAYKLWMKKAFKFGAMDMKEAMSVLLDDISCYIALSMTGKDREHAARVFRMFRWYGEAAINNNAKYKITSNYSILSSDLHLGDCKIPYEFTNMHIDNKMYTITNTVTGEECQAEFYIENPVDTKLKIIVHATAGNITISLNGEVLDRFSRGMHRLEYDIEKSEKQNVLKVSYDGEDNGVINISNLVIVDMVYRDFNVEYQPTIGSGNKVMNDFINYITLYEDLLDNNKEYIDKVISNNYPITEAINRMLEYFELHHENKAKGKRLTIKK